MVTLIGIAALAGGHTASGLFMLLFLDLAPMLMLGWLMGRRLRGRTAQTDDGNTTVTAVDTPSQNDGAQQGATRSSDPSPCNNEGPDGRDCSDSADGGSDGGGDGGGGGGD